MEPIDKKQMTELVKKKVAPNADESCKFCGLWTVKLMDGMDEHFKCAIDYEHNYCEGKCSRYKEKKTNLIKRIFRFN